VAEPDGVPQEAWIRLGAVQEIVRTPKRKYAANSGTPDHTALLAQRSRR